MFVTEEDYKSVCDDFELGVVTSSPEERAVAERAAMEQIRSYIAARYDADAAFAAEGGARNAFLVQCAVNITLYLMIHRLPENMGHDRRLCLYEEAVKWLKDVQAGKASPDLPRRAGEDAAGEDGHGMSGGPASWGSMPPNRYDY